MKVTTTILSYYVWLVVCCCCCCCYLSNSCFDNVLGGVYGCDDHHHYQHHHHHHHYDDNPHIDHTNNSNEEEEGEEEEEDEDLSVLEEEEEEERLLRTRPHIDKDVQVPPPRGGGTSSTIPKKKKKLKGKPQKKFQRCGTREPSTSEVRMVQHNLSKLHHERQRQRERRQMMMENSNNNDTDENANNNDDSTSSLLLLNHVDRILQGTASRIVIPVIFHIISNTNGDGDIADEYVQRQVDVLNESFSGTNTISPSCDGTSSKTNGNKTPFVFILEEINRITNNEYFEASAFDGEVNMRSALHKGDPCSTLNIYTKTFLDYYGYDTGLLGWSSFPWDGCPNNTNDGSSDAYKQQGISLNYKTLPGFAPDEIAPYEQGITLPHEAGHYFGIFHTFQTSGIFGSCYGIGDGIADTSPGIGAASGCNQQLNTCPGIAGYDSVTNFMNYSSDCCMDTFTPMQIEAMVLNYHIYFKNDET